MAVTFGDLPVVQPGTTPRERADAARNRARILDAAARLVAERGIDGVSMDDVAREACVGTGTLYRRFGDRSGLAVALLDEAARGFQDRFLAGPPPLGPGAAPRDRLVAFGEEYVPLLEAHAELMVAGGGAGSGPHAAYTLHLGALVGAADPSLDAPWVSEALLAVLAPDAYLRARRVLGWTPERIAAGWRELVARLVG